MNKNILGLLLLLTIISCDSSTKNNEVALSGLTINIDLTKAKEVKFSERFKSYDLVKLQTLPEVLLGDISKIKKFKGYYYILTEGKNNGLFKFDNKGNFEAKILEQGDAPGEYGFIENFDIKDGVIYLLDNKKLVVHLVNEKGEYQKYIKTGLFGLDIHVYNDLMFIYAGNSANGEKMMRLFSVNQSEVITSSFMPVDEQHAKFLHINPKSVFSRTDSGFSLMEPFGYGIMEYKNQSVQKTPIVFQGLKSPEKLLSKSYDHIGHFLEVARNENLPILFSDFLETNVIITFSLEYNGVANRVDVIYNKANKSTLVVDEYIDDMVFEGKKLEPAELKYAGYSSQENEFIYYMESPELTEILSVEKQDSISLKFSDNPYLIVFK